MSAMPQRATQDTPTVVEPTVGNAMVESVTRATQAAVPVYTEVLRRGRQWLEEEADWSNPRDRGDAFKLGDLAKGALTKASVSMSQQLILDGEMSSKTADTESTQNHLLTLMTAAGDALQEKERINSVLTAQGKRTRRVDRQKKQLSEQVAEKDRRIAELEADVQRLEGVMAAGADGLVAHDSR